MRDPESAWPTLLPVIDTAAPAVIISAPQPPMNTNAASASGVLDEASAGKRPERDDLHERHDDRDDDDRRDHRERHGRFGSRASPAGTGITS